MPGRSRGDLGRSWVHRRPALTWQGSAPPPPTPLPSGPLGGEPSAGRSGCGRSYQQRLAPPAPERRRGVGDCVVSSARPRAGCCEPAGEAGDSGQRKLLERVSGLRVHTVFLEGSCPPPLFPDSSWSFPFLGEILSPEQFGLEMVGTVAFTTKPKTPVLTRWPAWATATRVSEGKDSLGVLEGNSFELLSMQPRRRRPQRPGPFRRVRRAHGLSLDLSWQPLFATKCAASSAGTHAGRSGPGPRLCKPLPRCQVLCPYEHRAEVPGPGWEQRSPADVPASHGPPPQLRRRVAPGALQPPEQDGPGPWIRGVGVARPYPDRPRHQPRCRHEATRPLLLPEPAPGRQALACAPPSHRASPQNSNSKIKLLTESKQQGQSAELRAWALPYAHACQGWLAR